MRGFIGFTFIILLVAFNVEAQIETAPGLNGQRSQEEETCADNDAVMIGVALDFLGQSITGCLEMLWACTVPAYEATVTGLCPVTCGSCRAACDYTSLCYGDLPTPRAGAKCTGAACNPSDPIDRHQCCGPAEVSCPTLNHVTCRAQAGCWWNDVSCISMPCFDNDEQASILATKNKMSGVTDCSSWCGDPAFKSAVPPGLGICDSSCSTCPDFPDFLCLANSAPCGGANPGICCNNLCVASKCCALSGSLCNNSDDCCNDLICQSDTNQVRTCAASDTPLVESTTIYAPCSEWTELYGQSSRRHLISGGQPAPANKHPWQVYLDWSYGVDDTNKNPCGGTIIGPKWILTAAHCMGKWIDNTYVKNDISDFKVVAGLDINKVVRDPAEIYVPEDYLTRGNDKFKQHDIALVRLDTSLPCDDTNIRPISLLERTADQGNVIDECIAWATGFGLHSYTEVRMPDPGSKYNLYEVEMQVFDTDHCKLWPNGGVVNFPATTMYEQQPFAWQGFSAYSRITNNVVIVDSQVCAYSPGSSKNACTGDSGGPLMIKINDQYVQVGITSYGIGCGEVPGLYTDVSYPAFKEWIMSKYKDAQWTPWSPCDKPCASQTTNGDCVATAGCGWIGNACAPCEAITNCAGAVTCTTDTDSICASCTDGFYGDACAPCVAITNCAVAVTCSTGTDSICASCANEFAGDACDTCVAGFHCSDQHCTACTANVRALLENEKAEKRHQF